MDEKVKTSKLEEIKNKIASASGYSTFEESLIDNSLNRSKVIAEAMNKIINQIAKEYALACIKATLEKTAENAEVGNEEGLPYVEYASIVDDDNIVIL